jgi:hypothetical protein
MNTKKSFLSISMPAGDALTEKICGKQNHFPNIHNECTEKLPINIKANWRYTYKIDV